MKIADRTVRTARATIAHAVTLGWRSRQRSRVIPRTGNRPGWGKIRLFAGQCVRVALSVCACLHHCAAPSSC